ncbi:hypothetical protein K438DRAFT_1772830 [Mycena galopus ATCC 62051]|nr:hypothetical protein K438DRAFT_1772830 [Mycena galopus ATCC 62051]
MQLRAVDMDLERWKVDFGNVAKMMSLPMCRKYLPNSELTFEAETFARMGFSPAEMIGLLACGDSNDTQSVAHFDSTFVTFNNNVFAASPELFASTCVSLLGRMLETVPAGVQFTEVITPLPVKPSSIQLVLSGNVLQFSGQPRTEDTDTVLLTMEDHAGGTTKTTLLGSAVDLNNGAGAKIMRFLINGEFEDQNGIGFAVQGSVVFSSTSCKWANSSSPVTFSGPEGRFDFAIRNGTNVTGVFLQVAETDSVARPIIVEIDIPPPAQPVTVNAAYVLWSINSTQSFLQYTLGAVVDGRGDDEVVRKTAFIGNSTAFLLETGYRSRLRPRQCYVTDHVGCGAAYLNAKLLDEIPKVKVRTGRIAIDTEYET